jgi:hypothetical protein
MMRLAVCGLGMVMGLVALVPLAQPAHAQGNPQNVCWDAVTREARGMLNARNVSRKSYAIADNINRESLVTGVGQADGRPFTYRCTYNGRNGQVYGVSVADAADGRGPGGPGFGGRGPGGRGPGGPDFGDNRPPPPMGNDARRAAEQTCYDAVLDYAQRRNPTASNFKIFLSQNRFAQAGREDIRVTGLGELRQVDRLRVGWDYDCTYNARNGRVRDISMGRFIPNR